MVRLPSDLAAAVRETVADPLSSPPAVYGDSNLFCECPSVEELAEPGTL